LLYYYVSAERAEKKEQKMEQQKAYCQFIRRLIKKAESEERRNAWKEELKEATAKLKRMQGQ
jgi:protein-disulfide isomerase